LREVSASLGVLQERCEGQQNTISMFDDALTKIEARLLGNMRIETSENDLGVRLRNIIDIIDEMISREFELKNATMKTQARLAESEYMLKETDGRSAEWEELRRESERNWLIAKQQCFSLTMEIVQLDSELQTLNATCHDLRKEVQRLKLLKHQTIPSIDVATLSHEVVTPSFHFLAPMHEVAVQNHAASTCDIEDCSTVETSTQAAFPTAEVIRDDTWESQNMIRGNELVSEVHEKAKRSIYCTQMFNIMLAAVVTSLALVHSELDDILHETGLWAREE